jgi:GT2 family glycosyltransferase
VAGQRLWCGLGDVAQTRKGLDLGDEVRVSCVIPTHHRLDFLREAVESVVKQTWAPHEIIVVSDVADPDAEAWCLEEASRHGVRIEYVFDATTPGGASASRNIGGYRASGTHIAFLDDDDWWDEGYIEAAVECIRGSGADIVVTWRNLMNAARVVPGPIMRSGLRARDVAAISLGTTGSNMIVARKAFLSVAGFDPLLPVKNDTDFFYRLLSAGFDYRVVEKHLVFQRKHSFGQLTGASPRRANGTLAYLGKHRATLSLRNRRFLRMTAHRMKWKTAPRAAERYLHLAGAVANYSLRDLLRERRGREMWEGMGSTKDIT